MDLLARDIEGILSVIEVKGDSGGGSTGLSFSQLRRLQRVCQILSQYEPVQLLLAFAAGSEIWVSEVDGLTPEGDMGHLKR